MCQLAAGNSGWWYPLFGHRRVPVGYIDQGYALLSEAQDPKGDYHALWVHGNRSPLYLIDRVDQRGNRWGYTRQYSCNILECATRGPT